MLPNQPYVRIFDTIGLRMTGAVTYEDNAKVVLEDAAACVIEQKPLEEGGTQMTLRFDPIALIGNRYILYKSAIRGESFVTVPAVVEAYRRFANQSFAPSEVTDAA